jgi:hypothetical protein
MAGETENYSKSEVRAVVTGLQSEGVSRSEIHSRSVSIHGQKVFSRKEMSVWCNKFKDGRTAINDYPEKHRGRYRTSRTDENCVTVAGKIQKSKVVKRTAENGCATIHGPCKETLPRRNV